MTSDRRKGILYALGAAVCWAFFSPIGKWLAESLPPLQISGISYLLCGLTLWLVRPGGERRRGLGPGSPADAESHSGRSDDASGGPLRRDDLPFMGLSIFLGGILGPGLLLLGLQRVAAYQGSLLLNLEAAFTVAAGIILAGERPGLRGILGAAGIVLAGVAVCAGPPRAVSTPVTTGDPPILSPSSLAGSLLIAAACLAWALDNTVSRRLSVRDPRSVGMVKGLTAGPLTLLLAAPGGLRWPGPAEWAGLAATGGIGLGLSLTLYLLSLRSLGVTLTGAFFALSTPLAFVLSVILLRERPGTIGLVALIVSALAAVLLATDSRQPAPRPVSMD